MKSAITPKTTMKRNSSTKKVALGTMKICDEPELPELPEAPDAAGRAAAPSTCGARAASWLEDNATTTGDGYFL